MQPDFKYIEWLTLSCMVDVQIITLEKSLEECKDNVEKKVLRSELTKLKPIRTKVKKMLADY